MQKLPSDPLSTSQEPPSFLPGSLVDVRGERWQVLETVSHEDCSTCRLVGAGSSNLGRCRSILLPFDRPRQVAATIRWRRARRRRWVESLRGLLAADTTACGLRGAAAARIDVMAYQLEPALASAAGATRLLLADEVGLGKTIQAGLIVADLFARTEWPRVLVLCPASLCGQWERELADRFGLPASVADLPELRRQFRHVALDSAPWERLPLAIASVDFVKRPEVLQAMASIRWDLLVVDEAHLCASASGRGTTVNWLSARSRRVLLLTATPHPGEREAFETLCRVGRLAGEAPIVLFRRTRAALGLSSGRRVRTLLVRLSAAERRLHAELRGYASSVWQSGDGGDGATDARLALVVLTKRAASGPGPLLASLERRRRLLEQPEDDVAAQLLLPLGEPEQDQADEEPTSVLAAPGFTHRPTELAVLDRLISLARKALACDSKSNALWRLLRRVREPAIVFTEYRDALDLVLASCQPGANVAVIHGGLDLRARADAVRSFTQGGSRLLLATDAAAHGLNLQARCRLVINLDLPWNPVRLEQRIGRVDRIGQPRVVHAINMVGRATAETAVLRRLTARAASARQALGSTSDVLGNIVEMETARAVFGASDGAHRQPRHGHSRRGRTGSATALPPTFDEDGSAALATAEACPSFCHIDLSGLAQREATRLGVLRELRRQRGKKPCVRPHAPETASWSVLRLPKFPSSAVVAIFRADVVDGCGRLVEQLLVPLAVAPSGSLRAIFGDERWRSTLPDVLATLEAALVPSASAEATRLVQGLEYAVGPRLKAERRREESLALSIIDVPVPVQPGLFDRRALREAEAVVASRAALDAETATRLELLARAGRLGLAAPPRLVLLAGIRHR